jgi:hypothetical protein
MSIENAQFAHEWRRLQVRLARQAIGHGRFWHELTVPQARASFRFGGSIGHGRPRRLQADAVE